MVNIRKRQLSVFVALFDKYGGVVEKLRNILWRTQSQNRDQYKYLFMCC